MSEPERVMVHGIEVKPGQVWACTPAGCTVPPNVVVRVEGRRVLARDERDTDEQAWWWEPRTFARMHTGLVGDGAKPEEPASKEPERWTDAEWAAEQVALARRQAEVARAEAREMAAQLAEARAALEAARAELRAVERISLRPISAEHPDQRLVDGIVDAAIAARRGVPRVVAEGRDPATRTRALPVVPATCGACRHVRPYDGKFLWCAHEGMPSSSKVIRDGNPDPLCPIRSELAKAGGA